MTVLVDSNVILDVAGNDPKWGEWSSVALAAAAENDELAVNPLIYAEVSVGFERIEEVEEAIPSEDFRRYPLPLEAAFLAGKVFVRYRKRGGARRSPLPDFYIGAHAVVSGFRLLTRDPRRYRTYFPALKLISPR
ncbi:MAG: type II toxin-antitoxin system VapC family toxin [Actinomycetota bacterium]